MPVRRFWLMNSSIDRIEAERAMRRLDIAYSAQSDDGYKDYRKQLTAQVGKAIVEAAIRDEEGFASLKDLTHIR